MDCFFCSDDYLLDDEDELDYDLEKDEEDALLADDGNEEDDEQYENDDNQQEDEQQQEEAEDVLDIDATDVLDENIDDSYTSMII